jgi:8-oxo-dGTP pyrophosphatase MutT (NUDIX family)
MTSMIEAAILTAIAARLDAALTGGASPAHGLRVDGARLARFDAARMARLAAFAQVFVREGDDLRFAAALDSPARRSEAMEAVATTLAAEGALTAWRDERYAVRAAFDEPPAFLLERAAARYFGIHTYAAHANGLVRDGCGGEAQWPRMWLARRSPTKAIDPSRLDNLVGGGIPGTEPPAATLRREAWEEAGIADARVGAPVATLTLSRAVSDGFQHETIFVYDLWLPVSFVPRNQDGEAVEHRLVDFGEAARLMANAGGTDVLTIDATLVAFDCLQRCHFVK